MINFHKVLISTFIVFSLAYAVWSGWVFKQTGQFWAGSSAVGFGLVTAAFAFYLKNLERFLRR